MALCWVIELLLPFGCTGDNFLGIYCAITCRSSFGANGKRVYSHIIALIACSANISLPLLGLLFSGSVDAGFLEFVQEFLTHFTYSGMQLSQQLHGRYPHLEAQRQAQIILTSGREIVLHCPMPPTKTIVGLLLAENEEANISAAAVAFWVTGHYYYYLGIMEIADQVSSLIARIG